MKIAFHRRKGVWIRVLRFVAVLSEAASVSLSFSGYDAAGGMLQIVARFAAAVRRVLIDSEEPEPARALLAEWTDVREGAVRIVRRMTNRHWWNHWRNQR